MASAHDNDPQLDVAETSVEESSDEAHDDTSDAAGSKSSLATSILIGLCLLIPSMMQLMGGFGEPAQLETWGVFLLFDETGPLFYLGRDSAIGSQAVRPLTVFPHAVAYALDPDSFAGFHLVLAVALALGSFGAYRLLRELRLDRQVSLFTAMLFALFPAWTGLFTFRTAHFHFALGMLTIAAVLLMRSRDRVRWVEIVAMVGSSCVALMFYEGFYLLAGLVPLLLVVPGSIPWRRFVQLSALWFLGPVLNAGRILWVLKTGPLQYQESIRTDAPRSATEVSDLAGRIWYGATKGLVVPSHGFNLAVLSAMACLLLIGTLVFVAPKARQPLVSMRILLASAIVIAVAPFAALIYWNNPAWLVDPLRIFSIAALPISLGVGLAVALIPRTTVRTAVMVLIALSVVLSASGQRDYWHRVSDFQEHVAGELVLEMASRGNPQIVAVYDPEYQIGDVYSFLDPHLQLALAYLTENRDIRVSVCNLPVADAHLLGVDDPCSLSDETVTLADGVQQLTSQTLVVEMRRGRLETIDGPPPESSDVPGRSARALDCVDDGSCEPIPPSADPLTRPAGQR